MIEMLIETAQLLALLFIARRVSGGGSQNPPPAYPTESIYDVLGETNVSDPGSE